MLKGCLAVGLQMTTYDLKAALADQPNDYWCNDARNCKMKAKRFFLRREGRAEMIETGYVFALS